MFSDEKWHQLINQVSGFGLFPAFGGTHPDSHEVQHWDMADPSAEADAFLWRFEQVSKDYYYIINKVSGFGLFPASSGANPEVQHWDISDSSVKPDAFLWRLEQVSDNYYHIINKVSGSALMPADWGNNLADRRTFQNPLETGAHSAGFAWEIKDVTERINIRSIPLSAINAPPGAMFSWVRMREVKSAPAGFNSLSVADAFNIWALDEAGKIHIWANENTWLPLAQPTPFSQLAIAPDGTRMALDHSGNMWECAGADYDWTMLYQHSTASHPKALAWITTGGESAIYATGYNGNSVTRSSEVDLLEWNSNQWQSLNQPLILISAGLEDELWGIQYDKALLLENEKPKVMHYDHSARQWKEYLPLKDKPIFDVCVGDPTHIAAVDRQNHIYLIPGFSSETQTTELRSPKVDSLSIGADGTVVAIINRQPYLLNATSTGKFSPQALWFIPIAARIIQVVAVVLVVKTVYHIVNSLVSKPTSPHPLTPAPAPKPDPMPGPKPKPAPKPKIAFDIFPNIFSFGYNLPDDKNFWRFIEPKKYKSDFTVCDISEATKSLVDGAFDQGYNSILNIYNTALWSYCESKGLKYIVDLHMAAKEIIQSGHIPATYNGLPDSIKKIITAVEGQDSSSAYIGYVISHEVEVTTAPAVASLLKLLQSYCRSAKFYLSIRDIDVTYRALNKSGVDLTRCLIALQEFHAKDKRKALPDEPTVTPTLAPTLAPKLGTSRMAQAGAKCCQMLLDKVGDFKGAGNEKDYEVVFDYLINSRLSAGLLGSSMLSAQMFFDLDLFKKEKNKETGKDENTGRIDWIKYENPQLTKVTWNPAKTNGLKKAYEKLVKKQRLITGLKFKTPWSTPMRYTTHKQEERENSTLQPNGFTLLNAQLISVKSGNVYVGEFADQSKNPVYLITNHYTWKQQTVDLYINNQAHYWEKDSAPTIKIQQATAESSYEWKDVPNGQVEAAKDFTFSVVINASDAAFVRLVSP